mmetsp:Transcript_54136/g.116917  ORF Transcript_54136/g.116917 Transcript_54136/m.116917 type:complete len:549 (-) Transcript_54136:227-1873(-)
MMRGFGALFAAKPLSSRRFLEWQVVEGNFTTQDFYVAFSTLANDELRQRAPPSDGAVEADQCLAAYRLKATPNGTHVVLSQQPNSHCFPLRPRDLFRLSWSLVADYTLALAEQAKQQARRGWPSNRTTVPPWMLEAAPCEDPRPKEGLRLSLLAKAEAEFSQRPPDQHKEDHLPSGEPLRLWSRQASCGGASVPLWHAEFALQDVQPVELYNALVDKQAEPRWNQDLLSVELGNRSGGARSVHSLIDPGFRCLGSSTPHRDVWEWQAAAHNVTSDEYLLSLSSAQVSSKAFDGSGGEATECLAAFRISAGTNGSRVHMISHLNPKAWCLRFVSWDKISADRLTRFAGALSAQAKSLANLRRNDTGLEVDDGALNLLSPEPPDRNESVTLAEAAHAPGNVSESREFLDLSVPWVLNHSKWAGDFKAHAQELHNLLGRLAWNATEQEKSTFSSLALDAMDIQRQGEVLGALQLRALLASVARLCHGGGGGLPDIDRDKNGGGLSLPVLITLLVVTLLLVCILAALGCICCWKKRRAQRIAQTIASPLIPA